MNESVQVCLCSIPDREDALRQTLESIKPQLRETDHIWVCLNGYDHVPAYLDDPQVSVARSQDIGDRSDTNKFWFTAQGLASGYIVMLDDDIIYPQNHVAKLVSKLKEYDNKIVVSFHGERIKDCATIETRSLEGIRTLFMGLRDVPEDSWVHIVGTGSSAFHTDYVRPPMDAFPWDSMCDIWFGIWCQHHRIPLLVHAHTKDTFGVIEGTQDRGKCIWVANCLGEESPRNTYMAQLATILQLQPWTLFYYNANKELCGRRGGPREAWLYTKVLAARTKPDITAAPVPEPVKPAITAPPALPPTQCKLKRGPLVKRKLCKA